MMWGYGPHWGMGPWGGYGGGGPIAMFIGLIILALIIAAAVWFFRSAQGSRMPTTAGRSPGLDALEERYARGEIKREEYLEKEARLDQLTMSRWSDEGLDQ